MGREHWVETTLGDICSLIQRGKSPKYIEHSELPVINQKSIRWEGVSNEFLKYIHPEQYAYWPKNRYINEGDILINSTGTGTIGRACLIDKKTSMNPKVFDSHVTVLRLSDKIIPFYVFNWVKTRTVQDSILELYTGSTNQVELSRDNIASIPIPLPPLNEQKRIVEKLDAILPRVKSAKTRLAKIPVIVKKFRQSVLSAACSGRLTGDWRKGKDLAEWEEVNIDSVINGLTYGTSQKCNYKMTNEIPVLRIPNVSSGKLDLADLKYAYLDKKELNKLSLKLNDILIVRSNGSVSLLGQSVLVDESAIGFAYAGYLIRIRCKENILSPEYLNYALKTNDLRSQIELPARSTTGVHNINTNEIKALTIPLPPLEEQHEIVRRVEKLFALADSLEAKYNKAMERVSKIEQAVLAKAFRGELVDPDPNDEPAEELLKRILEEKARLDLSASLKTSSARRTRPDGKKVRKKK